MLISGVTGGAWLFARFIQAAVIAAVAPRVLQMLPGSQPQVTMSGGGEGLASMRVAAPKVTLRLAARRFASAAKGDDVDLDGFVDATEKMMSIVERFGDFTKRGVADVRQNLRRVRETARRTKGSMRAMLADEFKRGQVHPKGGPASRSGAESLLWARIVLSFWVELFDEHVKGRRHGRPDSLADESTRGFKRTISRYLDGFSRAAFSVGMRQAPDWKSVREKTYLGCKGDVCSEDLMEAEFKEFVKDVRPVIDKMVVLQKSSGLEDPRTP